MADIFKRLSKGRPPPPPAPPPLTPKRISRRARLNNQLVAFLTDTLIDGPKLATFVLARGIAYGFTKRQIIHARQRLSILAFKEEGQAYGRWFWTLSHRSKHPNYIPEIATRRQEANLPTKF
jgi:hypothetical protein